ncbi:MAG: sulfate permease [Chloroflexota bacterium]|nr:sulfate permease [Chloroflexota bacterium]
MSERAGWRRLLAMAGPRVARAVPAVDVARTYDRAWLRDDVIAGVTLAAVIVPVAMAYGQLAGLPPVTGIYASMLPLLAFALFTSTRQMVVGPDASSAALVAAAVLPLADGSGARYAGLAALLALLVGALCFVAGLARLGFIASFLSRPILVGYIIGLGLTIVAGQLPGALGIASGGEGFFPQVLWTLTHLGQTHAITLAISIGVAAIALALRRFTPRLPGSLLAVVAATIAVIAFGLDAHGVAVVGVIRPGLPAPAWPAIAPGDIAPLLGDAAGIALLTFSDAILNANAFTTRQSGRIQPNQELIGLGAANMVAGLGQGFPVGASGTRTAVSQAAGGKTQLASVTAVVTLGLILLFLTGPMSRFPRAALAALLIVAAFQIMDVAELRRLAQTDWRELLIALVALGGVLALGLLQGIALAIGLSLVLLLARVTRPHDAELVEAEGVEGYHDREEYPDGLAHRGLVIYRFDAPLFFANADFFRRRALALVAEAPQPVEWLVVDAEAITDIDTTAGEMLDHLRRDLAEDGVTLAIARAKHPLRQRLIRLGLYDAIGAERFYPAVRAAVAAWEGRAPTP